ncbi:MAG: ATP-dependent protease subunit HslV [Fidelibacterota bacterium]
MKAVNFRSTTILGVRRKGVIALGGDGQVTFGEMAMKHKARKIRKMYNSTILTGFAGASADALTLFEKLEGKLDMYNGNLFRAAVELAKDWRTDKYLRRLEALLAVMNREKSLIISGNGDIIEPDDDAIAIGTGGGYALAAARALLKYSKLDAGKIVEESLKIASRICIYTNENIIIEELKIE